ncbi:hypothetical protein [Brevundimonas subvibrioides]|uniref:Uncharacterized protein n=1 Tax=Brevundimonas subvibrioides (strain ATCC 15264 / DSM 4735 / LMG 14903 / NBRC 16000 / CB 81) TaxID=633149 RepID=D9QI65_BRESC|nr:hypothetical protein [Brevundimonas subvibrioides]ADL01323.1 hypothetical protein Bresu_2012 [Brevundimonas subvibrioides ATCC 15264]
MRTSEECLDKAHDLDCRAAECPAGDMRDAFGIMAVDWRRLAVTAAKQEAFIATMIKL